MHSITPDKRSAMQVQRLAAAQAEVAAYTIIQLPATEGRAYAVRSPRGDEYVVTKGACTCPDHQYRCAQLNIGCKHRAMVMLWYHAQQTPAPAPTPQPPAPVILALPAPVRDWRLQLLD